MQPPPGGLWGMPPEMLKRCPATVPTSQQNRAEARAIMKKLGYGPDKRLKVKVSTRDIPPYRDPAVILIDQLKEIYIDGELEPVDTAQWYPKMHAARTTRSALNLTGTWSTIRTRMFYENYVCGGVGNYNGYCNPEIDKLIDQQSMEAGPGKAQADRLGDRAPAGRGRRPAAHLLQRGRQPAGSPRSRA